jgi:hypothetical protein
VLCPAAAVWDGSQGCDGWTRVPCPAVVKSSLTVSQQQRPASRHTPENPLLCCVSAAAVVCLATRSTAACLRCFRKQPGSWPGRSRLAGEG